MRRLCWSACTLALVQGQAPVQYQRMMQTTHACRTVAASIEYSSVSCCRWVCPGMAEAAGQYGHNMRCKAYSFCLFF